MLLNRKSVLTLLAGMILVFGPRMSRAQDADKTAFDKEFIKEAAQWSLVENDICRMPKDLSNSDGVKHYAELVLDGQKKLLTELRDIAKTHNYTIPSELTDKQKETKDRLSKLKDTNFDVEFMSDQVQDQQSFVDLFDRAAKTCVDKNLSDFAQRKVTMLRDHLANAQELYKKIKAKQR